MPKNDFVNEQIEIASNHLLMAKEEITECADKIYENLQKLAQSCQDEASHSLVMDTLAALQFQDIVTQRLDKLKDFLSVVDKSANFEEDRSYLEAFAWENEVDQNDIDQMFNDYKG